MNNRNTFPEARRYSGEGTGIIPQPLDHILASVQGGITNQGKRSCSGLISSTCLSFTETN